MPNSIGFTVVHDPEEEGPRGHALIPELSIHNYEVKKKDLKPLLVELAKLASAGIVDSP